MNNKWGVELAIVVGVLTGFTADLQGADTGLPGPGNNKVAYYVFDSGGPDHYPMPAFTEAANIVVVFEGTLWELADSAHYATSWMRNVNYHSHAEVLRDIKVLQARGVKVLMNVDDAASWSTSTPFTTYDGRKLTGPEFAAFIKACAIDSVGLDGISLDIEHGATGNAAYISLLKEIGKYFGPLSPDSATQMYIAAIYAGGAPGPVIGKSRDITAHMNFIMDMAYFVWDYTARFRQWADSIGASRTMVGVLNDYYDVSHAMSAAAWQPASPPKAGIMVYAANNLKSYTDAVFNALVVPTGVEADQDPAYEIPEEYALLQNYPNPFNPSTTIEFRVGGLGPSQVRLAVSDMLGREVAVLVDEKKAPGNYRATFDGARLSSGVYLCRLHVRPLDFPGLDSDSGRDSESGTAGGRDSRSGAEDFVQAMKLVLVR